MACSGRRFAPPLMLSVSWTERYPAMSPSEDTNEATRCEWRTLGFFYDRDDRTRKWRLVGSLDGLQSFVAILRAYGRDPRNARQSEHDHYGPYMYLKVMTWPDPGIDGDAIYGSLGDLIRLAGLIEQRLQKATPGDTFGIADAYTRGCEYDLVFEVADAGFDPATADPCLA